MKLIALVPIEPKDADLDAFAAKEGYVPNPTQLDEDDEHSMYNMVEHMLAYMEERDVSHDAGGLFTVYWHLPNASDYGPAAFRATRLDNDDTLILGVYVANMPKPMLAIAFSGSREKFLARTCPFGKMWKDLLRRPGNIYLYVSDTPLHGDDQLQPWETVDDYAARHHTDAAGLEELARQARRAHIGVLIEKLAKTQVPLDRLFHSGKVGRHFECPLGMFNDKDRRELLHFFNNEEILFLHKQSRINLVEIYITNYRATVANLQHLLTIR